MKVGKAKQRLSKLIAKNGQGMAVFFNEPIPDTKWKNSADAWLDELASHKTPDNAEYCIHTANGYKNPVGRISLLQNKRGEYAVLISTTD